MMGGSEENALVWHLEKESNLPYLTAAIAAGWRERGCSNNGGADPLPKLLEEQSNRSTNIHDDVVPTAAVSSQSNDEEERD
eukprot:CAMPEP_0117064168 /NCGR_PEP_ID=MMETSP0472-20121206/44810_1 /TAXON_ID=693140 ORGANISM="Tiarina fusus, Strain LIS" /NCGR_SAMPLE_ID=MMETSP0472 /ASSEMBLY_ACC=CAM_ASM_000603 /LENGTH=80 /DNA_ID=CAMNT_0004784191 /DNA_START=108 /DNA_END=351 /DNA_ORIENTATION=+